MTRMVEIKERPIIFSGPMVRAILEGRKSQTRRIVKRSGDMEFDAAHPHFGPYWLLYATEAEGEYAKVRCPYGAPGDRLWVRETWAAVPWEPGDSRVLYQADYPPVWAFDPDRGDRWRPSVHMARWASRITLEITGVRVERLQDISEAGAMAEGAVNALDNSIGNNWCAREAFAALWEQTNGAGSWDTNPWVWVVEFRRQGVAA